MGGINIKNDIEAAVRSEVKKQVDLIKGPSQAASLLKEKALGTVSWLAREPRVSSWLPMEKITKATSKMLQEKRILCQCPICLTDSIALAANSLPPCYCRGEHYGISSGKITPEEIVAKVKTAIRKVTLLPKHGSQIVTSPGQVKLLDFGVYEGSRIITPLLASIPGACTCESCQEDTLAYGLNKTNVKYGIVIGKKLRMPQTELQFFRHHLQGILSESAKVIALNPRHGGKETL